MQVSGHPSYAAIDLFREGLPFIVGAKSRLYVTEFDAVVISQQGGDRDGGRIALR